MERMPVLLQPIHRFRRSWIEESELVPKCGRMVEMNEVDPFMGDHIVEYPGRCEHESDVDGDRPVRAARTPSCLLMADANSFWGTSESFFICDRTDSHLP